MLQKTFSKIYSPSRCILTASKNFPIIMSVKLILCVIVSKVLTPSFTAFAFASHWENNMLLDNFRSTLHILLSQASVIDRKWTYNPRQYNNILRGFKNRIRSGSFYAFSLPHRKEWINKWKYWNNLLGRQSIYTQRHQPWHFPSF